MSILQYIQEKKWHITLSVLCLFFIAYALYPYIIRVHIDSLPESLVILDRHQNEIWELIYDWVYRHRYKDYEYFPDFLVQTVIATEDRRFFEHRWVDYIWLSRALINNLRWWDMQWASTIHSQLVRNRYWLNEKRSYTRKAQEFLLARSLERTYQKEQILEMYLNYIHFWYLNYGFESASLYYYGKGLNHLTRAEMIWLVTLIKNPRLYNPYTNHENFRKRFETITESLYLNELISETQKILILEESLSFLEKRDVSLPYIRDFIQQREVQKNWVIQTTFDTKLSKQIEQIWSSVLELYHWKNVGDYSVIVIERESSEVKVMIWGNDYDSEQWQVNGSLALRQPGSTLKPFIYALAFRDLWYHPGTTILDVPINFTTSEGNIYSPKNYTLDYKWEITLAEALAQSINIPAVKLLSDIGISPFMELLASSWISSLTLPAEHYGLSLWLGSGEVSLYELTQAYSLFAHTWTYCEAVYVSWVHPECREVFEPEYIEMIQAILSDRYIKSPWFHLHSNLDFPDRNVFVKTGTSRNFRDNWTIGYTDNYIIGVWVGNKDASEMQWVSWVDGAGNIFHRIVYLLEDRPTQAETLSFERDTKDYVHITSPTHNSIYKFNPVIPLSHQKIKLSYQSNTSYERAQWFLNGKPIKEEFISVIELEAHNTFELKLYKNDSIILEDIAVIHYISQ